MKKEKYRDGLIATCKVYCHIDYDDDMEILELMFDVTMQEMTGTDSEFLRVQPHKPSKAACIYIREYSYDNRDKYRSDTKLLASAASSMLLKEIYGRCSTMTGRIKIIGKVSSVVDGRRQQEETEVLFLLVRGQEFGKQREIHSLAWISKHNRF